MIEELALHNFKCLQEVALPCRPLTVLSGLNGMGKSTAIQAMLLLRQSHFVTGHHGLGRLLLNGPLVSIGNASDALCEAAEDENATISLGIRVGTRFYDWQYTYAQHNDALDGLPTNPDRPPGGTELFGEKFHYLRAERLGPRPSFPVSAHLVREQRQLGRDGEYAPFFLVAFGAEEISNPALAHPAARSLQLQHQVEAWMGEISPGTRIFTDPHYDLDVVSLQFAFDSELGETNHYRASNVGFGMTYILPVIVAVLSAQRGTLLLLENPEAHLHPRGQSHMGRLLALAADGGVQIFVETHSDHLLNGIRRAVHQAQASADKVALHYFYRPAITRGNRSAVSSPVMDADGRIEHWPDGFFDETDKALSELLLPGPNTSNAA